jgi:hypothetical protein
MTNPPEIGYLYRMGLRLLARVAGCGVAAILAGTPVRADDVADIHFVEGYAGPHRAEFTDLLGQVQAIVPSALAYITGQWNLPNTLHHPLIVLITDNPADIPKDMPTRPVSAYVRAVTSGDVLRQELIVDLQHHLMYPGEKLDDILYHEMAHAVLQDAVTGPAAAGIPQWFNEGLAQSVTTEGHDRTVEDYKQYGHSDAHAVLCDLNGHVDTFYHGEYNFGCYTQYYLAVQRLVSLGGKDTVVKAITGLHNGTPLPLIIGQVTGLDWPTFQDNIRQYTQDVFAGNKPIP